MKKYIIILLIIVFLAGAVYYLLLSNNKKDNWELYSPKNEKNLLSTSTLQYKNISRNFILEYPKEFYYKENNEGDTTYTIVFSDEVDEKSFQLFFTPYYGNQITKSRMLKDIPSGKFTDPLEIIIGNNIRALLFYSTLDIGEMVEVWFLYDGYLYQVTAPRELEALLSGLLNSLKFYTIAPVGNS
ncbi:MAG: hypothetical protein WAW92_04495 [Minisyncoccia bacterium]